jgi:hypothetical protein
MVVAAVNLDGTCRSSMGVKLENLGNAWRAPGEYPKILVANPKGALTVWNE